MYYPVPPSVITTPPYACVNSLKGFVEINGPLFSMNFNNKFFHFSSSNTNTIHVISEKIKNYTGDCEKHGEISMIGQYLSFH